MRTRKRNTTPITRLQWNEDKRGWVSGDYVISERGSAFLLRWRGAVLGHDYSTIADAKNAATQHHDFIRSK